MGNRKGNHNSPNTEFKKGLIPWNKGLIGWTKGVGAGFQLNNQFGKINIGKKRSKEQKKKLSLAIMGRKLTRKHIRNSLKRRPMSSLEIKFNEIIARNNLPYKFVGNGKFFIERKNPDFINVNGEKKAIEVYSRRHKNLFRGGINKWMQERQSIFGKYGWEILFFDETQVNEQYLLALLGGKGVV